MVCRALWIGYEVPAVWGELCGGIAAPGFGRIVPIEPTQRHERGKLWKAVAVRVAVAVVVQPRLARLVGEGAGSRARKQREQLRRRCHRSRQQRGAASLVQPPPRRRAVDWLEEVLELVQLSSTQRSTAAVSSVETNASLEYRTLSTVLQT